MMSREKDPAEYAMRREVLRVTGASEIELAHLIAQGLVSVRKIPGARMRIRTQDAADALARATTTVVAGT